MSHWRSGCVSCIVNPRPWCFSSRPGLSPFPCPAETMSLIWAAAMTHYRPWCRRACMCMYGVVLLLLMLLHDIIRT